MYDELDNLSRCLTQARQAWQARQAGKPVQLLHWVSAALGVKYWSSRRRAEYIVQ